MAEGERALTVMDSVNKHLATEHGVKLLDPPYPDYDPKWGSISILLPGHKENGAIFCHAASWAVVAEALLGRGRQAYDYYMRMAPTTKNRIAELHEAEPYVYSQHIAQSPYHRPGRARNSWLTGSAGWFMRTSSQYILGLRPELRGLRVDPAVPGWREFSAVRTFRGARYRISVSNPEGVEKGVRKITVDGREIELTPTEFKILEIMLPRPGVVFSRNELIELVLGYDYEGYGRTLDSHIARLRNKIEHDPKSPQYIKTVFGIGYKLGGK